jgi:hypothetical protein
MSCLIMYHTMKTYCGCGGIAPRILNLSTRVVNFTPEVIAPGTHWIGGWVVPRAGLDTVTKRKNPLIAPAGNQTPVVQPLT